MTGESLQQNKGNTLFRRRRVVASQSLLAQLLLSTIIAVNIAGIPETWAGGHHSSTHSVRSGPVDAGEGNYGCCTGYAEKQDA